MTVISARGTRRSRSLTPAAISGCWSNAVNNSAASEERQSSGVINGACSRLTYNAPLRS